MMLTVLLALSLKNLPSAKVIKFTDDGTILFFLFRKMKRIIFMGIAIMAIFVSSCKKSSTTAPVMQTLFKPWQTKDWIIIKKNVNVGGVTCNIYKNKQTGQKINVVTDDSKVKLNFDRRTTHPCDFDNASCINCSGAGNSCYKGTDTRTGEKITIYR